MTIIHKMVATAALASAALFAGGASAQTYNLNFGPALTGQITTAPSTGGNSAITGISGTFNGQTITGLIGDPYSPVTADYNQRMQTVTASTASYAIGDNYYTFNNLLLSGNTFDSAGLLFATSSSVANLYTDANGFELISNPTGSNAAPTGGVVLGTITQAAAVPEPATWGMMILGMGAVGFAMRRRQKVATRVSYAA